VWRGLSGDDAAAAERSRWSESAEAKLLSVDIELA
jgi:hypothetical protein